MAEVADALLQIGWWLPYDSLLNVEEDDRFISLNTAQDEGGIREPYKTEVVPVYVVRDPND